MTNEKKKNKKHHVIISKYYIETKLQVFRSSKKEYLL